MPLIAITRAVSPRLAECIVTHVERTAIDVQRAAAQHRAYEGALIELGCALVSAPPADDMPDAVFVEDAALVFDELAILTRPGVASRRREPDTLETLLARYRPVQRISAPATLDGGDVLRIGRTVFVGAGGRTNSAGVEQLRALLAPHDYHVQPVDLSDCLHLKTAVTAVDEDTVLINPAWIGDRCFAAYERLEVDAREPFAANTLRIGGEVLVAAAHGRTAERLERHGLTVRTVDVSELAKAEAGVTCCSVLVAP